jgi:predicted RNase H-like HicB family nuclease
LRPSSNGRQAGTSPACPELGVASQGKTRKEAHVMLAEAVELWLEVARAKEIKRRLKLGGNVQPLQLAHA